MHQKHTQGFTPHNPRSVSAFKPDTRRNHTPALTPSTLGRRSAGFTILFAVLVASLLLSIGLAIFNIALKEIILSSTARESQYAFYAADSGIECALYFDLQEEAFSISAIHGPIDCNDAPIPNEGGGSTDFGGQGYGYVNRFTLMSLSGASADPCAVVTVIKTLDTDGNDDTTHDDPFERTKIESRGRSSCDSSNPRRVERAIELPEY